MKTINLHKEEEAELFQFFEEQAESMSRAELASLERIMSILKMKVGYTKILDKLQTNVQKIRFAEAISCDMSENETDKLFV